MKVFKLILVCGLVAGTLDITDAIVFYGLRGSAPVRILQSIAGGVLGKATFQGGASTAILGLSLHFVIATTAATVFYLASQKIAFATRHPVIAGLIFGSAVYAVMNYVVLPLSKAGTGKFSLWPFVNGVAAVVLLVGLPISLLCSRYSDRT